MLPLSLALVMPLLILTGLVQDRTARATLLSCAWGIGAGLLGNLLLTALLACSRSGYGEFSVLVAPPIEELLKALPFLAAAILSRFTLIANRAPVYAAAAGIGFAMIENVRLLFEGVSGVASGVMVQVIMRGITTTVMHALVTGLVGISCYLLCNDGSGLRFKPLLLMQAWGFAAVLHALFNLYVIDAALGSLVAIVISVLTYCATAWVAYRVSTRRSAQSRNHAFS